ncbi:MAG: discoidin domain-containing protein [Ignavibacteriales bacterium]|nr:discoidin domain-containing protein [Ignavibacteriales bacterium]
MTRRLVATLAVSLPLTFCSSPAQQVKIAIDAGKIVRPINPWLYGINTARWDESLFPGPTDEMLRTADRDAIEKIKASGVTLLKYPGGNDADQYIWNSSANNATEMNTDEYISLCREVGAEPFITVNFNEPPDLAAEWVRYCNIVKGYSVKLWEVGDEQWGTWARGHAPPEEYAKKYVNFVRAMRAVDPTIKVATNVPLGLHPENWAERVLKAAGEYVDMLTYTFFPQPSGKENDDTLMTTVGKFRTLVTKLREDVERAAGPQKAASIYFINVGYNSASHSPGPQTLQMINAIWTADMLGCMAELGTDIACFWALHNFYPPRGGDYGYISSEGSNTPRYSYYVFPMFSQHLKGNLIATTSSDASVSAYASRFGKALSLILINKDKHSQKALEIDLRNFAPHAQAKAWILDEKRKNSQLQDITKVSAQFPVKVPPYSITAIEFIDRDSVILPTNLARLAAATASSYSTIGPHFKPASAIDGKPYTRWNSSAWNKSNGLEAQWFQLSWAKPQHVGFIRLSWGETHASEYKLLSSIEGKKWVTLREVKEGHGGVEDITLSSIKTRFLKIEGSRGTKGISAYSLREMEVYEHSLTK